MVQIGTIEYNAKVTGAGEAQSKTEELQRTQQGLAEASEESAASMNGFAGTVEGMAGESERAGRQTSVLDNSVRVFTSTLTFGAGAVASYVGKITGLSGVAAGAAGAMGSLKAALSGLTLSGVVGSVVGAAKGFVGWLAAGSAGALAFAGAIGFGLGLLGTWVLKTTGALKAVKGFGTWVRNSLPAWVSDGILQMISLVATPLATFGAFIIGTFEGGFSQGIKRAKQVLGIFEGAWNRQLTRIGNIADRGWSRISTGAKNLKDDVVGYFSGLASGAASNFKAGFNSVIPSTISIPSVTIGGGSIAGQDIPSATIGGQNISLPRLRTGGTIEESGAAVVHEGEAVIPEPLVSAARTGGDGGGSNVTNIESVSVTIDAADFDPSNMSRRELESFADRVAKAIGKKTNASAGVR